ncbi:MAG TPA: NAD(P)H-hydrate dehydratase [Acidobacteriaceae bacterium]|nr:NAD(P)H-hydrate dehydratase [Acidobacteriaceae bacterium]
MQIVTAAEMAEADRRSTDGGVPVAILVENAGAAVARFVLRYGPPQGLIVALCGKGNNGGDGVVAALHLAGAGRQVRIALLGSADDLKPPVTKVFARAETSAVDLRQVADEAGLRAALKDAALVLDAVVGTGFKPPLRGLAASARDLLAVSPVRVFAVDLPSGWDADATAMHAPAGASGQGSEAFRADAVVTFAAPKLAHIFGHLTPGRTFGPVVVAGIGTPPGALTSDTNLHWAGTSKRVAETPRDVDSNKGKFGHVLLIGGAFGKSGAPSMMSLSALRTGAGLVTAAVPRSILLEVARITPELMTTPLAEAPGDQPAAGLSLSTLDPDTLAKLMKGIKVVGIGPGLGQEGSTPEFVRRFVQAVTLPTVIDADALNALAGHTGLLKQASAATGQNGKPRILVLTPHPGEMARLLDCTVKEVEADRVNLARRFATDHGVHLVLKGWRTLVAHPDGRIAVNTTGNPSMAKGGSGDILTGIVAAMLAQYPDDPATAVEAAVFLHGLAGDLACLAAEEHTVLATDTVAHLARAFRNRATDAEGLTWIAGTATNDTFTTPGTV